MNCTILALDASSTMIGYCVYDGTVLDHGEIKLTGTDIADRCRQAHAALNLILATAPDVDAVAIEAPAASHKKGLIPQCRVSGALMAAAALKGLLVVEVTPAVAKQALAKKGDATKAEMLRAAALYFGYQADALEYLCHRGEWGAWGAVRQFSEHEADALGVALAATKLVTVERQAA